MEIKGQIEDIIFQNEVNGYTIATFKMEKDIITIVGYLPFINSKDTLKLIGKYVTHPEYGEQFKIDTFEKIMPETLDGLVDYLSGGTIKGIGATTAKRIVETFKDETISILKFEPQKLASIKGISEKKAIEISEEFNEKWELWQIVGFLQKFGISIQNCKKVYDKLGKDAISEIENNPYILLDISYGVDFKKIDKMAMDLGISFDNQKRIESAIKYGISIANSNGHTCVLKQNLITFIENLTGTNKDNIENGLINLKVRQEIVIELRDDLEWVYLYPFYKAEQNIAEKIKIMIESKNIKRVKDLNKKIEKQEKEFKIKLSDKQKQAIEDVNENNICIITGGPGTRKNYNHKKHN